jgi:hypothetical protein
MVKLYDCCPNIDRSPFHNSQPGIIATFRGAAERATGALAKAVGWNNDAPEEVGLDSETENRTLEKTRPTRPDFLCSGIEDAIEFASFALASK